MNKKTSTWRDSNPQPLEHEARALPLCSYRSPRVKFVDVSIAEAANCLQKAIDIYTDMGRFTIAAKHHQVKKLAQVSHHFIKN